MGSMKPFVISDEPEGAEELSKLRVCVYVVTVMREHIQGPVESL